MTKNIKIHIFFIFLKFQKPMELNKCIHSKNIMKIFIEMFSMIFQSSMGLGKSRCDFLSGTKDIFTLIYILFSSFVVINFIAKKCCDVNDQKLEAS